MRTLAALSGVFLGAILLVIGYAMAYLHGSVGYSAPLVMAVIATLGLPVLYLLKAMRRLPQPVAKLLFAAMLAALLLAWFPLVRSAQLRGEFLPSLIIFSSVWLVASLPLLRAGIRYRP